MKFKIELNENQHYILSVLQNQAHNVDAYTYETGSVCEWVFISSANELATLKKDAHSYYANFHKKVIEEFTIGD